MPVHAWNLAKTTATKRGETLAEWLSRAIYRQAQEDAGERVSPSAGKSNPTANPVSRPDISPDEVEALARSMKLMADAAEVPVPKTAARHVIALATQHMRAARGLPEPKPRAPRRKVLSLEADNPAIPQANHLPENG